MTIHRGSLSKRGNPESVDEGNQLPNTAPVILVIRKVLAQPDFLAPRLDVEEHGQCCRFKKGQPALDRQGKADGHDDDAKIDRVTDEPVHPCFDQRRALLRVRQRRQVRPKMQCGE